VAGRDCVILFPSVIITAVLKILDSEKYSHLLTTTQPAEAKARAQTPPSSEHKLFYLLLHKYTR
jgi:hypothetical protein